jgi:single-stranded-DNA-specific exonuclease
VRIEYRKPSQEKILDPSLPSILDRLYRNRGIQSFDEVTLTTQGLAHFRELLNSQKAAELIASAMRSHEQICIIGDFDADGATSTALCKLAFNLFDYDKVDYLVPNRFDFGYGLSPEIVQLAYQNGAKLIITVDNGIACLPGVALAKELGLKVLITDHHLPGDALPNADVIVNPNQPDCNFPSKNLAGVGVAFYVMLALRSVLDQSKWFTERQMTPPNFASLLDIVAVGTVADVVPLDKNNRILIHQGLQRIRSGKTRPGIKAIIEVAGRELDKISASDLGFVIGPRLNAAGRLDDMAMGIETLIAPDIHQARLYASNLDSLNQTRKEIESSMQAQAKTVLDKLSLNEEDIPSGLVLYNEEFHQGVIGIVAGRIKERYNRPTIVFAQDEGGLIKGSARSIKGVHVRDLLDLIHKQSPDLIAKFGGHAMAAGLTIKEAHLSEFKQAFEAHAHQAMENLPKDASIFCDGPLDVKQINLDTAHLLKIKVPWGQQFEEPCFEGVFQLITQKIVGQKHLKMVVNAQGTEFDAIAFNIDTKMWPNTEAQKVRLVYKLDINSFRGNVSVQLLVDYLETV